jgi:hypothetical protein
MDGQQTLSTSVLPKAHNMYLSYIQKLQECHSKYQFREHRGHDHMVVGFITTYAISAYYH